MNRFQTIRRPDDPDLEPIYEEIVDHGFGEERLVNWFVSQSMRRDILATTWALGKGLMLQGVLPATVKQLIVVAVYTSNNCRYCRVTHSKALEALEGTWGSPGCGGGNYLQPGSDKVGAPTAGDCGIRS